MEKIKVSIILPTYNGERFISQSLDSVVSQSYKNWELLVIDDGSTDKTSEIVNKYSNRDRRIQYIKNEENLGIQKALNKGLKLAKGEYIARIDDDDIWIDKDKLKKQVEFLDKNSDYVLVGTGVVVVDENRKELFRYLNPDTDEKIRKRILSRNCFTHSSVLFRKDVVLKLGGYDESEYTRHSEDYDLWLRVGRVGKFANLPTYSIEFTMRKESISSKNKETQFRININIAKKYKKFYPNYFSSHIKNEFRLFGYFIFKSIPFPGIRNLIIRKYKEL